MDRGDGQAHGAPRSVGRRGDRRSEPRHRLEAGVGHAVGRDRPELGVEHFQRDDTRRSRSRPGGRGSASIWKSPSPGKIRSASPASSRGIAAEVADLDPGEVLGREIAPGPRTCSARCSSGTGRGRLPTACSRPTCADQGQRRVEAGAEPRRLLELQGQADAEPGRQLGRLGQRLGGPAVVLGRSARGRSRRRRPGSGRRAGGAGRAGGGRGPSGPPARAPVGEQEPPLPTPPRRPRAVLGEQRPGLGDGCDSRNVSSFVSQSLDGRPAGLARRRRGRPRRGCSGSSPG